MEQAQRRDQRFAIQDEGSATVGIAPSRWTAVVFNLKSFFLRRKRLLFEDRLARPRKHSIGRMLIGDPVLARSETPLWNARNSSERELVLGKIQNLRKAIGRINSIEVPGNQLFSFWRQLGRTTRLKGFVKGRELRQGCMIATTGGGICQLSNALYQCALGAGFEIVERHAHSKVVPGSLAEQGLDATVFWNYVDLRFKSSVPFRIEAFLTRDSLVLQFRGKPTQTARESNGAIAAHQIERVVMLTEHRSYRTRSLPVHTALEPHSCTDCGTTSCFRNAEKKESGVAGRTAFLVDECWPEFDQYIQSVRGSEDVLGIPISGTLLKKGKSVWTTTGFSKVKTLTATALLRSFAIRGLPKRGAPLQSLLSRYDERLAQGFAGVLTPDVTHVVVSQSLLPALWMGGHLGGRTFDVLMTRPPMVELEKELDRAHLLHPESWTLSDFRARSDLKRAEADALAEAGYLVTPHAEIAKRFGARAIRLDWRRPSSYTAVGFDQNRTAGRSVLFPESTLARKGAYELREAARALDLEIVLLGPVLEDPDFWGGVRVRQAGDNWLKGIDVVCLPSFVASSPRRLLNAVAQGVPVITTPACGLGYAEGVTTVMPGDAEALIGEIERVLEPGSGVLKSKILRLAKS